VPHNLSEARAKGGEIFLPYSDSGKIYALDGEWEFYYGELYTPKDFELSTLNPQLIDVPSSWDEAGYPLYGCATYRLTAFAEEESLRMFMPEIIDSSTVWINGEKVFEAGIPGKTKEETKTSVRNGLVNVRFENGQAEIIVQAANYGWRTSGLVYSATLGQDGVIMDGAAYPRMLLAFIMGILMAMSMYHAVLFTYRPNEKVYLAFSLVCLFACARFTLETNSLADLFIRGGIGILLTKALVMFFILHSGAVVFFAYCAFAMKINGKFQRTVYISAYAVTTAAALFGWSADLVALTLIPLAWSAVDGFRYGNIRENPYNGLFVFAIIIAVVLYPSIIFFFDDSLFVPGIAPNLFLTLSQCVMLSVSYAETKKREEELARKTNFYHKMAHDLLTPLTIVSTSIQLAVFKPEEASEELQVSQKEIMKMARKINDALSDIE
jgi:hypothetical protein